MGPGFYYEMEIKFLNAKNTAAARLSMEKHAVNFATESLYCIFCVYILMVHFNFPIFSHPVEYHNATAGKKMSSIVLCYYLLPILVISIVSNAPRFFEVEVTMDTFTKNVTLEDTLEAFEVYYPSLFESICKGHFC